MYFFLNGYRSVALIASGFRLHHLRGRCVRRERVWTVRMVGHALNGPTASRTKPEPHLHLRYIWP